MVLGSKLLLIYLQLLNFIILSLKSFLGMKRILLGVCPVFVCSIICLFAACCLCFLCCNVVLQVWCLYTTMDAPPTEGEK